MTGTAWTCVRCAAQAEPLARPPVPGKVGDEIAAKVCPSCWREWEQAEVMVINELRLNFMDPGAQEVLERHMRDFLMLDGGTPSALPMDATPNH